MTKNNQDQDQDQITNLFRCKFTIQSTVWYRSVLHIVHFHGISLKIESCQNRKMNIIRYEGIQPTYV